MGKLNAPIKLTIKVILMDGLPINITLIIALQTSLDMF